MKTTLSALLCAFALSGAAFAAPRSTAHRLKDRGEADAAIQQLLAGDAVEASLSRLKYLGAEAYGFEELAPYARSVDDRQRRNVALALATLAGPGDDGPFYPLLRDADGPVRMYALKGLAKSRSRRPEQVLPLLADKNPGVRREAARALGAMHQPKTGKLLMRAAQGEGEPEVRAELLFAVGESGDKGQVKPLRALVTASSESTRFAAGRALCRLGDPSGLAFAKKLLGSSDKYERRQVIALFEGAPAKVSGAVLRPLLADPDRALAAQSARVLHQGGEPKMIEWLVTQADRATGDDRSRFEDELETLDVGQARRDAIRKQAARK